MKTPRTKTGVHVARRRGFTLVEVISSLGAVSVLLVALGGALLLALRAVPARAESTLQRLDNQIIVDQIASDLAFADVILDATERRIEIVVTDRTGDGVVDEVVYSWSGVVGDPLIRTLNGDQVTNIASSVSDFRLAFRTRGTLVTNIRVVLRTARSETGSEALVRCLNQPELKAEIRTALGGAVQ